MDNEKIFDRTGHYSLWSYLENHPDKREDEWPGWETNGGTYPYLSHECFACEYAGCTNDGIRNCRKCPFIKWRGDEIVACTRDLYGKWEHETDKRRRASYARQIKNLEIAPDVKCK